MKLAPPFLFAADLDGALLPNTGKPSPDGCLGRTCNFLGHLRGQGTPVAYVTHRPYEMARASVGQFGLPSPDYWLCNAGTEIRTAGGDHDPDWSRWLGPELEVDLLVALLGGVDGLVNLDRHLAGRHRFILKVSGRLGASWVSRARQALAGYRNGLRIEANFDESLGITRVEVLPDVSGKLQALDFLAQRHALPRRKVFYAGVGDHDVLTSGVLAVQLRQAGTRGGNPALACGTPYLARDVFGDGILEGLRHFELWPDQISDPRYRRVLSGSR